MSSFRLIMKKIIINVLENLIKLLWIQPIRKRRVLFISYAGAYSDSPKYLYRKIKELSSGIECIWAVNKSSSGEKEINNCKKVQFGTFSYINAICTSKIVVTNNFLFTYIPRRSGQYIINTWHGGSPLKTVGMVNESIDAYDKFFYTLHAKKYNVYFSSSEFMSKEVFKKSFAYQGRIFNCGLPRNAILFKDDKAISKYVSNYFNTTIDDKNGVILYAPTFRGNANNARFIVSEQQFDIEKCIIACEKRFRKKYKLFFRGHYFEKCDEESNIINATKYPDMQELLVVSDILITDYSSCMGDFCLTKKPVFLYTPDLNDYISERGFYWDIFSLPFPVAKNQNELYNNILQFDDEKYKKGVESYLQRLKSYEGPNSDEIASQFILDLLDKG